MSCSGLYTDVRKSESKVLDDIGWEKLKQSYMRYLGNDLASIQISSSYSASEDLGKKLVIKYIVLWIIKLFLVTSYEPDLQFVRIYFDTPTFDRITKDEKVKFVDILSAVGGTMGLFTGFSIISGMEILYFSYKLVKKIFFK